MNTLSSRSSQSHLSVLSLLTIILLITIASAIDPRAPVLIYRPLYSFDIPNKLVAWKHREWQHLIFRRLMHFFFVHQVCQCGGEAVISNHQKLLQNDQNYISSEIKYLAAQREALPDVKKSPTRPPEPPAAKRTEGFFDEYLRVFIKCRQLPSSVQINPAGLCTLDGNIITIIDPIWSLYVQSEAFYEAAEQHRAILKTLWPSTARGITQRSRAANEASNRQPRVMSYTTPWMNRQRVSETQDSTMNREWQTGPHDGPTQDTNKHRMEHSIHHDSRTNYQSGLPDASSQDMSHLQVQPFISPGAPTAFCQQPESQASNLHASSGLRYGTHGSNSERDDDHQLPPSAKGLPSFRRSFGSDAWQRKEEPIDSTRWAKELKESERTYRGRSSDIQWVCLKLHCRMSTIVDCLTLYSLVRFNSADPRVRQA